MSELEFYYDFGSPNAYLAWEVLKTLSAKTNLIVKPHPVLIGGIFKSTNNQPPWLAFGKCAPKMTYMQTEIFRFAKDNNIAKFKFNSHFPVNTLLAMRTAIAAQEAGVHDKFMAAVFTAMWEDSLDISQPEVLTKVLRDADLDGESLVAASQNPGIKQGLMTATQACVDKGTFGLPTFFFGGEIYFGKECVAVIEKKL